MQIDELKFTNSQATQQNQQLQEKNQCIELIKNKLVQNQEK